MGRDHDPSMEEILASIKKIIAEDNDAPAPQIRRRAIDPAALPDAPDDANPDILELTVDAALGGDDAVADVTPPLVASDTAASLRESLAVLATLSEPRAAPQIVRAGETSLESLVREMLRPMLKDWLDSNLPKIVEQAIAKEIGRITGRG